MTVTVYGLWRLDGDLFWYMLFSISSLFSLLVFLSLAPPSDLTSQLVCGQFRFGVGLDITHVTSLGFNPFSGNMASNNCGRIRVHDNVVWYEVDARDGACGNTLTVKI